jgi:anaerobic magnesium-protoporphyrin IX monomethyl ester cyclase
MKITLIYPPANDPRAPQLALPSLAAFLRQSGIGVDLIDANLISVRALLESSSIADALDSLRVQRSLREEVKGRSVREWIAIGEHLAGGLDSTIKIFSDRRFYDPRCLRDAREFLELALKLHSVSREQANIDFGLLPVRYEVRGIDQRRFSSILSAAETGVGNLFRDTWRRVLLPMVSAQNADLVGITLTNRQQLLPGLMLSHMLRAEGHTVVLGGALLTKFAPSLQALPDFFGAFCDFAIMYEGETAAAALIDAVAGAREFASVPNLMYRRHGKVALNTVHVEDVGKLPTPDFDGLPLSEYFSPEPVLPILTGKGCYFNRCKFCDIPYINHVSRKAYRLRDPAQIASDVKELRGRFNARSFIITDEALSPKLLSKVADALEDQKNLDCGFTGYARLEKGFTSDLCRRLASVGIRKLYFGLESGDQETIDHMCKGTDVVVAPQVLSACREAGIGFHLFSIVGFPEEPLSSMRKTLRFFTDNRELIEHPGNSFDIHPFGLELRTDYFRNRHDLGIEIDPESIEGDFVIGVNGCSWKNSRGVPWFELERLLQSEFNPTLRHVFRRYHATVRHLWPGFEEHAVLYFGYYKGRPFPFTTSVMALDAGELFSVEASAAVILERDGSDIVVVGPSEVIRIPLAIASELFVPTIDNQESFKFRLLGSDFGQEESSILMSLVEELVRRGCLYVRLHSG